jgi:flagellar L-ring protein precursor FlgH
MIKGLLGLFAVVFFAGCVHHQVPVAEEKVPPAPRIAVSDNPATPGSLWNEGRSGLFADHKARQIGDILTVAIFEEASASKEATTSTGRKSSASADLTRLFGLERNIATINKAIDPTSLISTSYENDFKGSGSTMRKEDLVATLSTRVVEVLPNGNLCIEGGKTVTVNNEDQIIRLAGIVRPADISYNNFVDSKYILDARISYTGKGVISDKQKPGWLVRVLDNVWPF